MENYKKIYDYIKPLISSDYPFNIDELKKNIIILVNITHCANNSNIVLESIAKLNKRYKDKGLRILAFPCFQFGMKKTRDELVKYIKDNGFDIGYVMNEVEVNGPKTCSLYVHLKEKLPSPQGFVLTENFTYFIADRRGKVIQRLSGNATFHELDDMIYQLL